MTNADPWDIIHRLVDLERRNERGQCLWCLAVPAAPGVAGHDEGCVFYQARMAYNDRQLNPRQRPDIEDVMDRINEIVAMELYPLRSMLEELTGRSAVAEVVDFPRTIDPEPREWAWAASRGVDDDQYPVVVSPTGNVMVWPRSVFGPRVDAAVQAFVAEMNR